MGGSAARRARRHSDRMGRKEVIAQARARGCTCTPKVAVSEVPDSQLWEYTLTHHRSCEVTPDEDTP